MGSHHHRAVLAGGCFWGMQDLIRKFPGVISTRVGYTGGDIPNATYPNHGTHAEGIEIIFDPDQISYRTLLEFFFQSFGNGSKAITRQVHQIPLFIYQKMIDKLRLSRLS